MRRPGESWLPNSFRLRSPPTPTLRHRVRRQWQAALGPDTETTGGMAWEKWLQYFQNAKNSSKFINEWFASLVSSNRFDSSKYLKFDDWNTSKSGYWKIPPALCSHAQVSPGWSHQPHLLMVHKSGVHQLGCRPSKTLGALSLCGWGFYRSMPHFPACPSLPCHQAQSWTTAHDRWFCGKRPLLLDLLEEVSCPPPKPCLSHWSL